MTPAPFRKSGRGIERLAALLKVDRAELRLWASSRPAGYNYVTFSITKRSGGKRLIEAPNDALRRLQKSVYNRLLRDAAVQTAASGFVPGRSLIDNVRPHLNSKLIIKIDLKNFFHSITEEMVLRYWAAEGWDDECSSILTRICCCDGRLPQGAPTSPALSNTINRGWDGLMTHIIKGKYHARYTRYADDITISFPVRQERVHVKVRPLLTEIRSAIENEGYKIQFDKGIKLLRRHQRQIVTGLVINEAISLPRPTRHRIRALRYLHAQGRLPEKDIKRLEGYERLKNMVDKGRDSSVPGKSSQPRTKEAQAIYNVAGDYVHGHKIGRDYNANDSSVTNVSSDAGHSRDEPKRNKGWSLEAKLTLAGIILATIVGIAGLVVAFTVPEVRQIFGLQ